MRAKRRSGPGGQGASGDGGGGGGGASGLSLDAGCGQWIALAGGVGGAGGIFSSGPGKGGAGGNACMSGASCAGSTPTNKNGSSATDDGAGLGGAYITGGAAGGGSGGFGGGGRGGGSDNNYNGAGGAGGGSFMIAGVANSQWLGNNNIAPTSTVTITPVIAPEYVVGLLPNDQSGLGLDAVMDNFAGQTQDGNAITRHSSNGGTNQEWGLRALPEATSSSHSGTSWSIRPAASVSAIRHPR